MAHHNGHQSSGVLVLPALLSIYLHDGMAHHSGHQSSGVLVLPALLSTRSHLYYMCTKHQFDGGNVSGPCLKTIQSCLPCMLDRVCAELALVYYKYSRSLCHKIYIGMGHEV